MHVLKEWRKAKKLYQQDLAQRAGVAHQLISKIERGDITPSMKTGKRIAEATGGELRWYEIVEGVKQDSAA